MSARKPIDLGLYLVVGPDVTRGRPVRDVVLAAVAGGATAVQLRQKEGRTRDFVNQARALLPELRARGVPLVVNDRVDVAMAVGADGVHVGQDDMQAADVRRLVGETMIVGLSITTADEARLADPALVDYAGVGPIFATPSKSDAAPPMGLEGTREACRLLRVPAVAIGGIDAANAAEVIAAGVEGVSVISAICGADDPERAARELARVVRAARAVRA
ncbi:MAG: thiamine phosphate synthase [Gemmatimonadota bacterium]|nr:thiamine phosphate synthase [Gemmatimonadota bacterium]MDE3127823.1 thiamine phosphate synthase [Gemmatimonadota bacterium]MDE3217011.1 thiamine phosphate synthase [Gemmatimonadota bacterium]